jgi:hypothetical protein
VAIGSKHKQQGQQCPTNLGAIMICEFCEYQHDNEGDRYGCPNCCGGEYDIDNQGQQCPDN